MCNEVEFSHQEGLQIDQRCHEEGCQSIVSLALLVQCQVDASIESEDACHSEHNIDLNGHYIRVINLRGVHDVVERLCEFDDSVKVEQVVEDFNGPGHDSLLVAVELAGVAENHAVHKLCEQLKHVHSNQPGDSLELPLHLLLFSEHFSLLFLSVIHFIS